MNNTLKRTPFYEHHLQLKGKMVEFGGWDMPVQYTTITQEHNAVRNAVGIFDISHMGQVFVWGSGAADYLQYLITNDIRKATLGKGIYAHLLNEKGGVIDDIFVYRVEEEKFLVILNASRADVDLTWMKKHKNNFSDVQMMEAPYAAGLALQGPRAARLLEILSPNISELGHHAIQEFSIGDVEVLIGRTGYTGEDGFELFAPAGHLLQIWDALFKVGGEFGLTACGLGARDTLRTEVAYPLYGHELDENHTPFESGLGWVVKMEKGNFIGRDALVKQKSEGVHVKLTGFKVETGGVARPGGKILLNGKEIGTVASGTFAPSLGYSIGLALLPLEMNKEGTKFQILQGARELQAVTVKLPFYSKQVAV